LWALIDLLGASSNRWRHAVYFLSLLAAWILGLTNELVHAKDAWASMPEALVLSALTAALAAVATLLGFSALRTGAR
jgi:hypothetical protein